GVDPCLPVLVNDRTLRRTPPPSCVHGETAVPTAAWDQFRDARSVSLRNPAQTTTRRAAGVVSSRRRAGDERPAGGAAQRLHAVPPHGGRRLLLPRDALAV